MEHKTLVAVTHTHTHTGNFKSHLKKLNIVELLFSMAFCFAILIMSKICFFGGVYEDNYIEKIYLKEIIILIPFIAIFYVFLHFFINYYKNSSNFLISDNSKINMKKFIIVAFCFLMVVYLIYYLSLYPGGVYIDTYTAFQALINEAKFTNQNPVLYTLIFNIVKINYDNFRIGFGIITLAQVFLFVCMLTYFAYWLLRKKVNSKIVTAIIIFDAIFKLFPLYSISVWKDTPFSMALFMYILCYIDILIDFKNNSISIKNIIKYNIFAILTMLFRNNGMMLTFLPLLLAVLINIKNILNKKILKATIFIIISSITILLAILIQKIYIWCGVIDLQDPIVGFAVPIQQIARVVVADGEITDDQKQLIEKILPYENIKTDYCALIVDPITTDDLFDKQYMYDHIGECFKLWIELFFQNPAEYFKAYLLQTSGFWTFNVVGDEAYVQAQNWPGLPEKLSNQDLIAELTNNKISFKDSILKYNYYSGGFFLWITLLSIVIFWRISDKKYILGYLPCMLLYATVMLATPMGQALRYAYILVLMMPLSFVYPAIFRKKI